MRTVCPFCPISIRLTKSAIVSLGLGIILVNALDATAFEAGGLARRIETTVVADNRIDSSIRELEDQTLIRKPPSVLSIELDKTKALNQLHETEISDEQLRAYLRAGIKVRAAIARSYSSAAGKNHSATVKPMRERIEEAIESTEGIDVASYFAIGHLVHNNRVLRDRIRVLLAARSDVQPMSTASERDTC